ncbi:MAG: hypothetical protein H6Q78_1638, partial [Candidatus Krumholzibacteriota bacterium]|nr:hypothetical protein [Candidatus Krumholzibacteriota bacterium]
VCFLVILHASGGRFALSAESAKVGPAVLGARFEYMLRLDEQPNPYSWNAATRSTSDRSRLMLDLKALDTRYGSVYIKGAAFWGMFGENDIQKRFLFEQGDYLWRQEPGGWSYSIRLFANERRFFAYDWMTPLIDDDRAGETGDNRGVRADATIDERFRVTGLLSLLGKDVGESKQISYVRALYSHRIASFSASYLIEDPGSSGIQNRAAVKTELVSAYKKAFAAVSYRQSGFDDKGLFFPSGSFDWGAYDGTNFSAVLPGAGAASAEVRVRSIPLSARGEMDLVWRYDAVGEAFADELGSTVPSGVGQSVGAYFLAKDVSVNARMLYRSRVRSALENEEGDWLDAGVWAALENGSEGFLRGGVGKIDDESVFDTKRNFVHGAVRHRTRRIDAGAHVMWSDAGTAYSAMGYAWEGKLALNAEWGFHWRLLLSRDYAVGQTALFRLEYRPNNRIFAYVGYGRPYLGDDPFVLEDRDLGLLREGFSEYTIAVRGDF